MINLKKIFSFLLIFAVFSQNVLAATFTVTENTDASDAAPGNGVCATAGAVCTLRAAIEEANALGGTDTINFSAGNKVINPTATYTISSQMTIDGSTVGVPNTADIDGNDGAYNAFTLDGNSDGTAIKGLYIHDFGVAGILIQQNADSITIGGSAATDKNYIGLAVGETADGNTGGGISSAGTNVTIQGNVISGNTGNGISIRNGSKDVTIKGNRIGTDSSGTLDRGNTVDGINVSDPSTLIALDGGNGGVEGLVIGSNVLGAGNIIGGNDGHGIKIGDDVRGVSGTVTVQGDYIGLNEAGAAVGNTGDGIHVESDASTANITVGTDGDGTNDTNEANVISGNSGDGIEIEEGGTVNIAGNKVGLTPAGTARGNTANGITIGTAGAGPDTLRIGSDNGDANEMNTIGNNTRGVNILNATIVNVAGNYIGFDTVGASIHQNTQYGIYVAASQATTVNIGTGGTTAANRNYVGNNGGDGIEIASTTAGATVKIKNNVVGVAADFTTSAGNAGNGIRVAANATTTIGTDLDGSNDSAEANVVGANSGQGIFVEIGATIVAIAGNIIGLKGAGGVYTTAAANGFHGIHVNSNSVTSLTIGGSDNNQRNVIGSNGSNGIDVQDAGNAIAYTIRNNYIGFGSDGSTARGNTANGISIADGGAISIIDNVIGNNVTGGVYMTAGTSLTFTGNKVGTTATGIAAAGNTCYGLVVAASTMTDVDIGSSSTTNVFAANTTCSGQTGDGIKISNLAATNTPADIAGNYIGIGSDGTTTTGMGNGGDGILIQKGAVTIGGDNDLANGNLTSGNIISNNTGSAISITGSSVTSANVYGNIIGLKKDGSGVYNTAAGNTVMGISFGGATALATVNIGAANGTTTASRRNILSKNGTVSLQDVIRVHTSSAITTLKIKNNYIGTDITGATALGNGGEGISIESTVTNLTIGSDLDGENDADEGNVISGSATGAGISLISTANVTTAAIHGNTLGMNAAKTVAMANYTNGIYVNTANVTTLNIGSTNSNSRNYISGNTGAGIYFVTAPATATINILNNIVGLNGAGTAAVANGGIGINLAATQGSTVNIGDGTSSGRNIIAGNSGVGITADGGTVTILDNYLGVAADGTTSLTNTTYEISSTDPIGGIVRSLKIGAIGDENKINNNTHAGVFLSGVTTWNESNSYLETNNTWLDTVGPFWTTGASFYYWFRSTSSFGPLECYDGLDNDNDGIADYPSDSSSCSGYRDDTETNTGGGALMVGSASSGRGTSRSTADTKTTEESSSATIGDVSDSSTSDVSSKEKSSTNERESTVEDANGSVGTSVPVEETVTPRDVYVAERNVHRAINTVTDIILDTANLNYDIVIEHNEKVVAERIEREAVGGEKAENSRSFVTDEQKVVQEVLEKISESPEVVSAGELATASAVIENVVGKSIEKALKEQAGVGGGVGSGGGSSAKKSSVPLAVFVGDKAFPVTKETKIEFVFDTEKAIGKQQVAIERNENKLVLHPSSILGGNNVSALLSVQEGVSPFDPLAGDKIFFKGIKGLRSPAKTVSDLKPEKPEITNLDGLEVGKEMIVWIAAPNIGGELQMFVVDKQWSEDKENWIVYDAGKATVDEGYKSAVMLDFEDIGVQFSGEKKELDVVVQDEDGNGSASTITVDPTLELRADNIHLSKGEIIDVETIEFYKEKGYDDLNGDKTTYKWSDSLYASTLLASANVVEEETGEKLTEPVLRRILSGYVTPGATVFVTWKSLVLNSVVLADASQGYFELDMPRALAEGDHEVVVYSYVKRKNIVTSITKLLFNKKSGV
jgi:hypothetical protein